MALIHPAAEQLHAEKHREPNETFEGAMQRISKAMGDDPPHQAEFHEIISDTRFLGAGRVQAAMGSSRSVTAYNCFVSGTINDSMVSGEGSIMGRLVEAAATMRMGGGIGYCFSNLRPEGALIMKLLAPSSGPLAFMDIYDTTCKSISSAGNRRGAQMGCLHVWHPDIRKFIAAKRTPGRLTQFNLSVLITDAFMQAVQEDLPFNLEFGGVVYETIRARDLWDEIMVSTYDHAEPGVLFIDTINNMNNLWWLEKIEATNPCGEQPLPPFGACLLGSFNLTKYVDQERFFDLDQLKADIWTTVRAMDNVIDRTIYPLAAQENEAKSKRRMGLGVTGLANAVEFMLGRPSYGDDDFVEIEHTILRTLRDEAYRASIDLAKEKGAFPLYDDRYLEGNFIRKLPQDIQDGIARHGIRNSHLTSIAPTGSISLIAGNVSGGVEPVFAYEQSRKVLGYDKPLILKDYGVDRLGIYGRRTSDVTIDQHLKVLGATVDYIDSAVSKTCNVPTDISFDDFKDVYVRAWAQGNKGCTTFRLGGKREGILKSNDDLEPVGGACVINEDGSRSCEG